MNLEDLKRTTKINLDEVFKYEEALKRLNYTQKDIDAVRDEISQDCIIPKFITNGQLLIYLHAGDGDLKRTAHRLHTYYKCKKEMPEFFKNRNPESPEIVQCFNSQYYVTFPPSPDNCNLIYTAISNHEPKSYVFDEACKTFIMLSEAYLYRNGPRADTIFLFDLKSLKLGHIFQPAISSIRKGMHFLENATPMNIKAVHIFNTVPFIRYIFALVKPFTTTGILSKIHLHSSDMDWNDFHQNYIPKSHLPSDYQGDLPSLQELHNKDREFMMRLKDYFVEEEKQANHEFDHLSDAVKLAPW